MIQAGRVNLQRPGTRSHDTSISLKLRVFLRVFLREALMKLPPLSREEGGCAGRVVSLLCDTLLQSRNYDHVYLYSVGAIKPSE